MVDKKKKDEKKPEIEELGEEELETVNGGLDSFSFAVEREMKESSEGSRTAAARRWSK